MSSNRDSVSNRRVELCSAQKETIDLQREVLASLFNATERSDELPRTEKAVKRSTTIGQVVVELPKDSIVECKRTPECSRQHNEYGMDLFPFNG